MTIPTITISVDSFSGPAFEFSPALEALETASNEGRAMKLGSEQEFDRILDDRAAVVIQGLEFDPDPFVLNNILITNTTSMTQTYTLGVALPTSFAAPSMISGEILTGVIDGGTDGATVAAVAGFPIYSAQIDSVTVATLQDAPFSLSTLPGNPLNSASASFGPLVSLTPVASNIGIQLRFSLTPGDTVSILSRFDVVAVPEPTSLCVCMTAACAAAVICGRQRLLRRRRAE